VNLVNRTLRTRKGEDRPRTDEAGEEGRLIGDEVREGDADTGDGRFVERDHRVAERNGEQESREAEHLIAGRGSGEHHADALPDEEDHGKRDEETVADADEPRLLG
jgi:hypothetical protein